MSFATEFTENAEIFSRNIWHDLSVPLPTFFGKSQ